MFSEFEHVFFLHSVQTRDVFIWRFVLRGMKIKLF